jgi:DNA-binding transcriptional LysR family regulator
MTTEDLAQAIAAYRQAGTIAGAARLLGRPRPTVQHQIHRARDEGLLDDEPQAKAQDFTGIR